MKKTISKATEQTLKANNIRRDWGAISPVTKVIPDKRRKAPKHKGKQFDY